MSYPQTYPQAGTLVSQVRAQARHAFRAHIIDQEKVGKYVGTMNGVDYYLTLVDWENEMLGHDIDHPDLMITAIQFCAPIGVEHTPARLTNSSAPPIGHLCLTCEMWDRDVQTWRQLSRRKHEKVVG